MLLGIHFAYFDRAMQYLTTFTRYVPNPSPAVFRTTKNNHNILQGVADPDLRLTAEAKAAFDAWILKNGLRWTAEGGPLAVGGVDIAFIGGFFQGLHTNQSESRPRRSPDARLDPSDQEDPPRPPHHLPFPHRDP